jgi:hypothetical protein
MGLCSAEAVARLCRDEGQLKLLAGALHALRAQTDGEDALLIPDVAELMVVPLVAYHVEHVFAVHSAEPKVHVSKALVNVAVRLQEHFEMLVRRVVAGHGRLPRRVLRMLHHLAEDYVCRMACWNAEVDVLRAEEVKQSLLQLIHAFSTEEAYDEEAVMRVHTQVQRMRQMLARYGGREMAEGFFCTQFRALGKCLVRELEAPKVSPSQAAAVHHMLLIVDDELPRFPVIDMCFVAAVWTLLKKAHRSVEHGQKECMEVDILRAVLEGIAGVSVLALFDGWRLERRQSCETGRI